MDKNVILTAALFFALTGCSVGPKYYPPEMEIPCTWHSEPAESIETMSPDFTWWEGFQDPLLNELIALAADQNLDLQIAAIRIQQARSETKAKFGDLLPHIDGSVNFDQVQYNKNLIQKLLGINSHQHGRRNVSFFEIGFDAQWEIDLFGRTAHEIKALKAQGEAIQEDLCGAWLALSAEIAKNYIELRGAQQHLGIMERKIEAQEAAILLTHELLKRGIVNDSDLSLVQAEWNTYKAQIPRLKTDVARAIHHLGILLGYTPDELFTCLEMIKPLPAIPCEQSIGVPSDLLRRRPDIRKAERELAAATERIGSAIASLFPRFSLRGFLGEVTANSGSIFNPANALWFVGPQILVPIFNSKLLMEGVEYNKLATQQALFQYQKTVLGALEESENAIISYKHQKESMDYTENALTNHANALKFSEDLYSKGIIDYFKVQDVKKQAFIAEESYLQSKTEVLLSYISLYKALGGSWD